MVEEFLPDLLYRLGDDRVLFPDVVEHRSSAGWQHQFGTDDCDELTALLCPGHGDLERVLRRVLVAI